MAEVNITIAGRSYALHCRDGEEARLHQLSRMIADRVDKVKAGSPGLTEVRQFLFAALLLADDLSDAQAEVQRKQEAVAPPPPPPVDDSATAQALESLAERLEAIGLALAAEPG
ncbi:MAG TPA: cell division protein ZapA [Sphingobium sp.]